ncbi:MAG: bifunctional nuclease family protein [Methermicoccaceae archaeon]
MGELLMEVKSVYVSENGPFVALVTDEEDYRSFVLPIFIDEAQAHFISIALEGRTMPRPLTHDLMVSIINEMGGAVDRVVIDHLDNNIFYARLYIEEYLGEEKRSVCVDARPSDCIALCIRAGAPIYVSTEVMDRAAVKIGDENPM